MKELSIEEKAKAYDGAFRIAQELYNNPNSSHIGKGYVCTVFPELRESKDERIRKGIIELVRQSSEILEKKNQEQMLAWLEKQGEKEINDNDIAVLENWENAVKENKEKWQLSDWFVEATSLLVRKVEYMGQGIKNDSNKTMLNACINALRNVGHQHLANWLEKQGEQKSADKVEPKFHKGEWIIHQGTENIYQVVAVIDNQYQLKYGDNYTIQYCEDVDRCARLWDINKDAKPGDVIYLPNGNNEYYFFIFKGIENAAVMSFAHFYQYNDGTFEVKGTIDNLFSVNDVFQPATKEQRDTLMKAMNKAGYTFDFEKKELKRIEEPRNFKNQVRSKITDLVEDYIIQKPAEWSEEDEKTWKELIEEVKDQLDCVPASDCRDKEDEKALKQFNRWLTWLKSLKDRVQSQLKQEWKQENTDDLTDFENAMMHIGGSFFGQYAGLDPNDTNEIKKQANILLELVPKQEWNEEDENRINRLIAYFEDKESFSAEDDIIYVNWLNSLKNKVGCEANCTNTKEWSEEDELSLKQAIYVCHQNGYTAVENWLKKSLKPQNRWKPTEEQMSALHDINLTGNISYAGQGQLLISLYNDLKNLLN